MDREILEKVIKQRVQEAKIKRIWERASRILVAFGRKRTVVDDDHRTTIYKLKIGAYGYHLDITEHRYAYGGRRIFISLVSPMIFEAEENVIGNKIMGYKKSLVFLAAELIGRNFDRDNEDLVARSFRKKNNFIFVDTYIPGDWENYLDFRRVKNTIALIRGEAKERRDVPLDELETRLVKNFGINI